MQRYSKEDAEIARRVIDFYLKLMEDNPTKIQYYLSDNVVLDWFGKTIKEDKKVSSFIKDQMSTVTHHVNQSFPSENVAFRDTHRVSVLNKKETMLLIPSPPVTRKAQVTPTRDGQPSSSKEATIESNTKSSSPKKMKFEESSGDDGEVEEVVEEENETLQLKYVTAEGSVEFHKASSKKLQVTTSWRRPMKLHLGYTASSMNSFTIYLIIYEGNLKCRRNLYKEFCESDSVAKNSD